MTSTPAASKNLKALLTRAVPGLFAVACAVACSSESEDSPVDARPVLSLGDAVASGDSRPAANVVDGGVLRADRFATKVVSRTFGGCAGFGAASMPGVVLGPPVGAGARAGGLDVVSLGFKGEIVLSFEPNAIVNGPGADFIVFENAFLVNGNPATPNAELAEVSVSDDGVTWKTFPCTPGESAPYGMCAGWRPVYASPGNGISPVDPATAGGDPFDLSDVGVERARFVRIRDMGTIACPNPDAPANASTTVGFDLDAVALVHAETP